MVHVIDYQSPDISKFKPKLDITYKANKKYFENYLCNLKY